MARLPECRELAKKFELKLVSIADLIEYRLENETLIERVVETDIKTTFGPFKAIAFKQLTNEVEHLALVKGEWTADDEVPIRVHSSNLVGDVFQMLDFGKGPKLHVAMRRIQEKGTGAIIFINKATSGSSISKELKAFEESRNTSESNKTPMDLKDYGIGAQIIRELGIRKLDVLTNTDRPLGNIGYGLEVTKLSPLD